MLVSCSDGGVRICLRTIIEGRNSVPLEMAQMTQYYQYSSMQIKHEPAELSFATENYSLSVHHLQTLDNSTRCLSFTVYLFPYY